MGKRQRKRDQAEFKVVMVPIHDTGIGREAGYEDDAALIAAAEAERAALDPDTRRLMEKIDRAIDAAVLGL